MPMPNEQKVETRLPSAPILANPMLAVVFILTAAYLLACFSESLFGFCMRH